MKINTRALKISIIVVVLVPSVYMVLHKVSILTFLEKYGIGYSPCVESICISLDSEWVVVYNSNSIYEKILSYISPPAYPSMKIARINKDGNIDRAIFSITPRIPDSNLNKPGYIQKEYSWGKAIILNSETQIGNNDMSNSAFLSDYNVFVSANDIGVIDDISAISPRRSD